MEEVVARSPGPPRWLYVLVVVNGATAAYWAVRLAGGTRDAAVVLGAAGCLALAAALALLLDRLRARLVVTDDALRVERRWRPRTIARDEIRAVRGDVPDRPSWSQAVLVEVADGRVVHLSPLDASAGDVIVRLQRWAGVGERATPGEADAGRAGAA
ncbi:hypothetical protein [Cellulomonas septica]|uniref:DUF3093 domain-containing protein n=1 Tax=Cellulomonas septica TaxID=285080 RepID=A0ABX1JYZ5_9CELL|nr:hypothetical protein [Cellulomonas septica]NKY38970.1 hypothetical protein [Cellulomonas septica]